MKFRFLMAALVMSVATFAGCGKQEVEPAAPAPSTPEQLRNEALARSTENAKVQALLEQQRSTALTNVSVNASTYFAANPRFDNTWKIVPHTDDYISPSCPQGSGWAWVSIMRVVQKEVEKNRIWCSTSSASVGCYIDADFTKSPYYAQASRCDANLPHPLKPITLGR